MLPVSAIIATKDRAQVLGKTLHSLAGQSCFPSELIVVDASGNDETKIYIENFSANFPIIYQRAVEAGAAKQRMQGIILSSQPIIWFLDDDIILESECTRRLYNGFTHQANVGAVNSMITNQRYTTPGFITRTMYAFMHGKKLETYAGRIIGPAWNLLPENQGHLPDYIQCEWLNTTCTMYRKDVMPSPVFSDFFKGYSMFEDVALSVSIAKTHTLLNARTARIFHDSQSGDHKNNLAKLSEMELVNRYYVMTRVLNRSGFIFFIKLLALESFGLISSLRNSGGRKFFLKKLFGKIKGVIYVLTNKIP